MMPSSELTTTSVSFGVAACAPKLAARALNNNVGISRFIDALSRVTRMRYLASVGAAA
ncbi:hypothetical protein D3C71_1458570 [compost metagenome]